jgi:hypothetical protein
MSILAKKSIQNAANSNRFYKLSTICKHLKIAYGRVKVFMKLAAAYKRYILKLLDSEVRISQLKELRDKVTQARAAQIQQQQQVHITPHQLATDYQLYLSQLEKKLLQGLEQWGIGIILKEVFGDCLSVLTRKGGIRYEGGYWEITCRSGLQIKTRHLDLALDSLETGIDKTIGW